MVHQRIEHPVDERHRPGLQTETGGGNRIGRFFTKGIKPVWLRIIESGEETFANRP